MSQAEIASRRTRWPISFILATVGASALFAMTAFVLNVWANFSMMGFPCEATNSCNLHQNVIGGTLLIFGAPILLLVTVAVSIRVYLTDHEEWQVVLVWIVGVVGLFTLFRVSYYVRATALGFE